MSDFIKFYLPKGEEVVMARTRIILFKDGETHFAATGFMSDGSINGYRVSNEEYVRLCLELGV